MENIFLQWLVSFYNFTSKYDRQMLARQIINAQDIENFFGKKEATAYKILKKVKKYYNKEYITIRDFCDYYKMERKDMIESILAAEKALKPAAKSE